MTVWPVPSSLAHLSSAHTRSISPENFDGAKGGGARATDGTGRPASAGLGPGWKVSPSVEIAAGETFDLANIDGAGTITHIWMTTHRTNWRSLILRAYWDGAPTPAIQTPYGDFFGQGWGTFAQLSSITVAVNPNGGCNSYWPMPFTQGARLTLENRSPQPVIVYYQITYEIGGDEDVNEGLGYLHGQFHRSNPLPYMQCHPIIDGVTGHGKYVGTYLAWGANNPGWWGEGEVKFYLDGDTEHPTICGTGTEDYFGGAWNFDVPGQGYVPFSTPYLGMHQVLSPDGLYHSQQRFGMYRWHLADPIHFHTDLRVDIQALGWRRGNRYRPLTDDISSLALFYLDTPAAILPPLPDDDYLEVNSNLPD